MVGKVLLGPRLARVTLAGPDLVGFAVDEPAASVRLLVPPDGARGDLVMPEWTGNLFHLPDGRRAPIRTFTPRRVDGAAGEIDIDVVLHGGGVAATWAADVEPGSGAEAAISGPARGYVIDDGATGLLLAGDETAIPAISQLLEAAPPTMAVRVLVETPTADGHVDLPSHPSADVRWLVTPADGTPGSALVDAVRAETIDDDDRVWVAGEAAAVQRIRRHLFDERGLPRSQATVRGYWKHGRAGDEASADA